VRLGLAARTGRQRQRLRMIADVLLAQTDALALGLVDGRYKSVETAIDVLARFAASLIQLAEADKSAERTRSADSSNKE
jgi:hypothetical protein